MADASVALALFCFLSADGTLKIWDTNDRRSGLTIQAHQFEVLTCDWNKYSEFLISTGSVDKSIRTWVRRTEQKQVGRAGAGCSLCSFADAMCVPLSFFFFSLCACRISATRALQ